MENSFAVRLEKAMSVRGMKQVELVEITGISKGAISSYLNGEYVPKQQNTYKLSKALNVNPAWLMGKDVEMDVLPDNIIIPTFKRVPILGEIAAGEPIYVPEEHGSYININGDAQIDFCLKVKGNSMIGARIYDGDLVFVRKQPSVENGEIAVILVDGEATLKRFYKTGEMVVLKPENNAYQPMVYTEKDFKDVRVLGKAVLLQSKL